MTEQTEHILVLIIAVGGLYNWHCVHINQIHFITSLLNGVYVCGEE